MKITVVSFGAMLTPEAEVMRIAFEHGVNYVDTARRYMGGRNEEIVAQALKGRRDKVYVATKTQPASKSKEAIFKDVETSLRHSTRIMLMLSNSISQQQRQDIHTGDPGGPRKTERTGESAFLRG